MILRERGNAIPLDRWPDKLKGGKDHFWGWCGEEASQKADEKHKEHATLSFINLHNYAYD